MVLLCIDIGLIVNTSQLVSYPRFVPLLNLCWWKPWETPGAPGFSSQAPTYHSKTTTHKPMKYQTPPKSFQLLPTPPLRLVLYLKKGKLSLKGLFLQFPRVMGRWMWRGWFGSLLRTFCGIIRIYRSCIGRLVRCWGIIGRSTRVPRMGCCARGRSWWEAHRRGFLRGRRPIWLTRYVVVLIIVTIIINFCKHLIIS